MLMKQVSNNLEPQTGKKRKIHFTKIIFSPKVIVNNDLQFKKKKSSIFMILNDHIQGAKVHLCCSKGTAQNLEMLVLRAIKINFESRCLMIYSWGGGQRLKNICKSLPLN